MKPRKSQKIMLHTLSLLHVAFSALRVSTSCFSSSHLHADNKILSRHECILLIKTSILSSKFLMQCGPHKYITSVHCVSKNAVDSNEATLFPETSQTKFFAQRRRCNTLDKVTEVCRCRSASGIAERKRSNFCHPWGIPFVFQGSLQAAVWHGRWFMHSR